jgi:hypothetical protein
MGFDIVGAVRQPLKKTAAYTTLFLNGRYTVQFCAANQNQT